MAARALFVYSRAQHSWMAARSGRAPFDVRAEGQQLVLQPLVAAVDLADVADLAGSFGCQRRDHQRHAGADVRADHGVAAQRRRADYHRAVRVAQDDLCAEGVSEIGNIGQIDRGYEQLESKLLGLGARIERRSS